MTPYNTSKIYKKKSQRLLVHTEPILMLHNQDMCPWVSSVLLLNNNVNSMSFKCHYCIGGSLLGKQYSQLIQDVQDDAGTGPEVPGPDGGRHRPIPIMYLAARCAHGVSDNFATCSVGNTTCPTSILIISDDIRCNAVTNCASI